MKKEVFLAISIGFVLGLVITFGIWTANNSLKNLPQSKSTPTPTASTSNTSGASTSPGPTSDTKNKPSEKGTLPLTITSPTDEALLSKNALKITGSTSPKASVSIVYETGELMVEADSSGNFLADITLEGGYNLITVTAYDKAGQTATQTLTVTYTSATI